MSLKSYSIVDLFSISFIETRNNAKLDIYLKLRVISLSYVN